MCDYDPAGPGTRDAYRIREKQSRWDRNDRDDLCRLWQSQTVEKGRPAVPRFALTEDSAVPFYMPLSRWRRGAYGAAFVCTVAFSLQSLGHGSWPEYVPTSISVLAALIGIGLLLWQRDGSPTPNPEECVDSYRTALTKEFERQFKTERLMVIVLFAGWIAPGALHFVNHHSADFLSWVAAAVLAVLLTAGVRMHVRAANSVRSRLNDV